MDLNHILKKLSNREKDEITNVHRKSNQLKEIHPLVFTTNIEPGSIKSPKRKRDDTFSNNPITDAYDCLNAFETPFHLE
jgi:hypothetical protein